MHTPQSYTWVRALLLSTGLYLPLSLCDCPLHMSSPPPQGLKYSPTFHMYRAGVLVDRVVGKDAQRLHDHAWLHADQ